MWAEWKSYRKSITISSWNDQPMDQNTSTFDEVLFKFIKIIWTLKKEVELDGTLIDIYWRSAMAILWPFRFILRLGEFEIKSLIFALLSFQNPKLKRINFFYLSLQKPVFFSLFESKFSTLSLQIIIIRSEKAARVQAIKFVSNLCDSETFSGIKYRLTCMSFF